MRWAQTLPDWLRIAFVLFGVSTMIGGLADLSEMTVPALAIGLAWAAVGWKGGLPIIPIERDASVPETRQLSEALRLLRRRRVLGSMVSLLWLPFAALTFPHVPQRLLTTVFFASGVIFSIPALTWALSACPRCENHFFISKYMIGWWYSSRCRNCSLPIRGVRDGA
jgi:hypothetical protein